MTPAAIETVSSPDDLGEDTIESLETNKPPVKVWLVDDNEFLRTHFGNLLAKEDGIECPRHFASPVELLNTLANQPAPDVILLDVQMGPHNGLDAVRPIKQLAPAIRVLMFTTCFDTTWRYRAFQDGASDYLLKSYDLKKVADRIRCSKNDVILNGHSHRKSGWPPDLSGCKKTPGLLNRTVERFRAWWN